MTPGDAEYARSELEQAAEALSAGRLLIDAGNEASAVSRLYYAVFHAARAALVVRGLHAKTHGGQALLFSQTYGESTVVTTLLEERIKADYGRGRYTKEVTQLRRLASDAEAFVACCRSIVEEAAARGPDEPDPPPDL